MPLSLALVLWPILLAGLIWWGSAKVFVGALTLDLHDAGVPCGVSG